MRLSKINYYSDFVVYPLAILILGILGLHALGPKEASEWIVLFLGSILAWTLIEYFLHRVVFHHVPVIRDLHQAHHDEERELLGTPIYLSLLAHLMIVFLPALVLSNLTVAAAISAGIMAGYLWYVAVHHIVHHWHTSHRGYLYKLKRRHALHHHATEDWNFGVTTGIWDRVFQTAAPDQQSRRKAERPIADGL